MLTLPCACVRNGTPRVQTAFKEGRCSQEQLRDRLSVLSTAKWRLLCQPGSSSSGTSGSNGSEAPAPLADATGAVVEGVVSDSYDSEEDNEDEDGDEDELEEGEAEGGGKRGSPLVGLELALRPPQEVVAAVRAACVEQPLVSWRTHAQR